MEDPRALYRHIHNPQFSHFEKDMRISLYFVKKHTEVTFL